MVAAQHGREDGPEDNLWLQGMEETEYGMQWAGEGMEYWHGLHAMNYGMDPPLMQNPNVVSCQDELLQLFGYLDYSRPVLITTCAGEELKIQWHENHVDCYPVPCDADYPLIVTPCLAWPTTLMFKMLPDYMDRDMLAHLLVKLGFEYCFDFMYVPFDFEREVPLAYGFVNMRKHELAVALRKVLDGYSWPDSEKACMVIWARRQGFYSNLEFYRNNSVNHPGLPQQMKPVIYNRAGKACSLRPNGDIKKPKKKNTGRRGDRSDVQWQVQAVENFLVETEDAIRKKLEETEGTEEVENEICVSSEAPPGLDLPVGSRESGEGEYWSQFHQPLLGLD
eukprot:TRINITY_DN102419_c0_g1_i1.p1 TRINITY_DN102419_c0_g1~~TRINITY_DN102419_c0_g1_i1.p1  ORF type:complete len:336 (-),score=44.75 TRINITY_DN102419_c0_g1_i1:226-1233(-)